MALIEITNTTGKTNQTVAAKIVEVGAAEIGDTIKVGIKDKAWDTEFFTVTSDGIEAAPEFLNIAA